MRAVRQGVHGREEQDAALQVAPRPEGLCLRHLQPEVLHQEWTSGSSEANPQPQRQRERQRRRILLRGLCEQVPHEVRPPDSPQDPQGRQS